MIVQVGTNIDALAFAICSKFGVEAGSETLLQKKALKLATPPAYSTPPPSPPTHTHTPPQHPPNPNPDPTHLACDPVLCGWSGPVWAPESCGCIAAHLTVGGPVYLGTRGGAVVHLAGQKYQTQQ